MMQNSENIHKTRKKTWLMIFINDLKMAQQTSRFK